MTVSRAVGVAGSPLHRFCIDAIVLHPIHFIGAAACRWAHDATVGAGVRADGSRIPVDVAVGEGTVRDHVLLLLGCCMRVVRVITVWHRRCGGKHRRSGEAKLPLLHCKGIVSLGEAIVVTGGGRPDLLCASFLLPRGGGSRHWSR